MKLMIVDDEQAVHDAIRLLGKWDKLGIDQVLSAEDGVAALKCYEENRPDIVLVDMKMPQMNGMELISVLQRFGGCVTFIIISSYDTFEYVRFGLKENVIDYLLKPVDGRELNMALERAVQVCRQKRLENKEKREYVALRTARQDEMIKRVLCGHAKAEEEKILQEVLLENEKAVVCVFAVLNLFEVAKRDFEGDYRLLCMAISNVLAELLSPVLNCRILSDIEGITKFAVITAGKSEENYTDYIHKMLAALSDLLNLKIVAAVGGKTVDSVGLPCQFRFVYSALQELNFFSYSQVICEKADEIEFDMDDFQYYKIKALLERAFAQKDIISIKNYIRQFFEHIEKRGIWSIKLARWIATQWMMELDVLRTIYHFSYLNMGQIYFLDELERNGWERVFLEEKLLGFFKEALEAYTVGADYKTDCAAQIKKYIEEYYYTDISLATFSDQFYMSKNYLSKIFKDAYDIGIYEYLLKVRMEQAANMLKNSTVKVRYISERLCFNDNNYFSKAFKKFYGLSPLEYRKRAEEQSFLP